jgi:NDP-sugar pyrophosphorylase family protein
MLIKILNKLLNFLSMSPDKIRYFFYVECCDNYDAFSTNFFKGMGTKVYGKRGVGQNSYCDECCGFQLAESKSIYNGNNTWIGANVFIKEGVNIGNYVVIGANSVVTKDIPSNCIAVGAPIQIIKENKK